MASKKMWAKRPFGYNRKELDRGQVFELEGAANDEKLVRLGYVAELSRDVRPVECGECGAKFVDESMRGGHGNKRHVDRFAKSEAELEAEADSEERRMNTLAPLDLEKTAASNR